MAVEKARKIVVHIGTSADGYIARPDGDLEWLTSRPAPAGFYGISAFMRSIDTKVLGRKTYDASVRMGAKFEAKSRHIVFSRQTAPSDAPPGVEFTSEPIRQFANGVRDRSGKDVWLMGGGELIAAFLDAQAIDESSSASLPCSSATASRSSRGATATFRWLCGRPSNSPTAWFSSATMCRKATPEESDCVTYSRPGAIAAVRSGNRCRRSM
jgi:dihydrofolate reductase